MTVGEEALGDIGDNNPDGQQEVPPEGQTQSLPDQEENHTQGDGEESYQVAQVDDFLLQRREGFRRGLGQVGDLAKFRPHAGGKDQGFGLAGDQRSPCQEDVSAVDQIFLRAGLFVARHGLRFARYRGIVDAHDKGLDQAAIGGDVVPIFQQDHVAGDQLFGGHLPDSAVAECFYLMRKEPLECGNGFLGPVFLPEGEQTVDQNNAQDCHAERGHAPARLIPFGEKG